MNIWPRIKIRWHRWKFNRMDRLIQREGWFRFLLRPSWKERAAKSTMTAAKVVAYPIWWLILVIAVAAACVLLALIIGGVLFVIIEVFRAVF